MSFSPNELVWYKQDGQTYSAGYSIDSMLAKSRMRPFTTLNQPIQEGGTGGTVASGQFSDLFRYMGVPVGLSTIVGDEILNTDTTAEKGGVVSDSLFDRLLSLASPSENTLSTSENQSGGSKKDRRNRKTRRACQLDAKKSSDRKQHRRTRRK